ncbi:MAG: TRAP transporter small permease subunit [Hydrogenophaga sp.]|jgi:TRAP-type mannitol/chloroaromatic compound transport system permease small subunit|uniref:TRAP transporter small permease subunit n=1 Tax=Hydrogenophaga sp. TaxID=1904254 RepID=UPI0026272FA6|nr:TRAP transporter small permease subunit [Hydrogenophaga sp.]MCV0438441.1 TRAP transporter small permease subunit [Hydrogenophaga sp.]
MLKALRPLAAHIEGFVDRIGALTAWIALVMIGLVATNVVLRYAFSFGSVWAQELEWHLLAALILLGMSHALQRGDNVRVDLFYARYSPALKRAVDVIGALLLITVSLLFIWLSLGYVEQSRSISEGSPDPGGIPLRWLVKALIPLGYGLLVLQQLAQLVRLLDTPLDSTRETGRV